MHRLVTRLTLSTLAILCVLALASRDAVAASGGVDITLGSSKELLFTGLADGGTYTFEYDPTCANNAAYNGKPCYMFTAGQGMVGVPISSSACKAQMGSSGTPSAATCPATGVSGVTILLKHGGLLSIPDVKGHPGTACSPAPVLVKTGNGVNVVTLNDGCHETLDCSSAGPGSLASGDVDAADTIKGRCTSLVKH